jgi:hypothetical protein
MLYKDWRLISQYKLQQIPQKLIIGLIAILMRIAHPLILRHMPNKIKVYQSHLITPYAPLPEARKVEIPQPSSILMEGGDRCDDLFKCRG